MKTKLLALGAICLLVAVFVGCIYEREPKVGIPVGIPIYDVSGMWIGHDCYLTLTQRGDSLDGITKARYSHRTRQFKGTIVGNHIVLRSYYGDITYDLMVQKKKMKGTFSDSAVVAKPVIFKR